MFSIHNSQPFDGGYAFGEVRLDHWASFNILKSMLYILSRYHLGRAFMLLPLEFVQYSRG